MEIGTLSHRPDGIIREMGLLQLRPEGFCSDLMIIIPNLSDQGKDYGTETINLMFNLAFLH